MSSDRKKLFVGGLSRETSEVALKEHFSKYGNVVESEIPKDWITKISRGFGFVGFLDSSSAEKALEESHVIDGKKVDVKMSKSKSELLDCQLQNKGLSEHNCNGNGNGNSNGGAFNRKKIFVGGLSHDLTEEEFKNYFSRFGRITDGVVMHDSATNKPRGFGFITYDSEESASRAMEESIHELGGKAVEVKMAVPKLVSNNYITRLNNEQVSPHNCNCDNYYCINRINYHRHIHMPYHCWMEYYKPPNFGYSGGTHFTAGSFDYPLGAYYDRGLPYSVPILPLNGVGPNGAGFYILPHENVDNPPPNINGVVGVMGNDGVHNGFTISEMSENGRLEEVANIDANVRSSDESDTSGENDGKTIET